MENNQENIKQQAVETEKVETQQETKVEKTEKVEKKSDEEIYGEIEAEKLLKKKKKRKILTFCGLSVAFVLALTLIILAVVPVNLRPKCLEGDFTRIVMFKGDGSTGRDVNEKKFMKYYNKAFSQTCLSVLFSGSFEIEETKGDNTGITGKNGSLENLPHITLKCLDRTVTNQKGKPVLSSFRNKKWDGIMIFNTAYIVLNTTKGIQETTIYIVGYNPNEVLPPDGEPTKYLITFKIKADTSIIYNAWDEIVVYPN